MDLRAKKRWVSSMAMEMPHCGLQRAGGEEEGVEGWGWEANGRDAGGLRS